MIRRLSSRDRRALGWGAIAIAPALAFRLLVMPYVGALTERSDRMATERDLLAREIDLIARAEDHPARFAEAAELLLAMAPRVFDGEEPMLAVGEAERYVEEMLSLGPVIIDQLAGRVEAADEAGLLRIRLEVKGKADYEGLLGGLRALEGGGKIVHVERLGVRAMDTAALPGQGGYQVLSYALTLSVFALVDDSAARVARPSAPASAGDLR